MASKLSETQSLDTSNLLGSTQNDCHFTDKCIFLHGNCCIYLEIPFNLVNDVFQIFLAATKQLYEWFSPSVCLSVCPSHLFRYVPVIASSWNFQELLPITKVMSMQKVKVRGQSFRSQRSQPNLTVSGLSLQFEFTYDVEMMHIAWWCLGEGPYCFWRSSVKFQGHAALRSTEFDPDWAFPDCNSS